MSKQDVLNRLDEVEESVRGPGRVLREARKAKQMDQIEVSRFLNLDLTIISGLEQDDYENLPPSTFTRGYIQSYARYLALDPELIIKEYDRVSSDQPSSLRTELMRKKQVQSSDLWVRLASLGLLLLVIVLVAVWWVKRESMEGSIEGNEQAIEGQALIGDSEPSSLSPVASVDTQNSEPTARQDSSQGNDQGAQAVLDQNVVANDVGTDASTEALGVEPVVASSVDETSVANLSEEGHGLKQRLPAAAQAVDTTSLELSMGASPVVEASSEVISNDESLVTSPSGASSEARVETEKPAVASDTVASVATELGLSDGSDLLAMHFADDCWTSVRDRNGRLLVYRTVKKGVSLNVRGDGPFQVHLGNAPVVTLELNGNKFDFDDKINGRIARFSTR